MTNPLKPLPTERLVRKRMLKDVDALAKRSASEDRGPWDDEARRQHDGLMKKRRIALAGRGACIIAALILWIIVGALAAKSFDYSIYTTCPVESYSMGPTTQMENH